MHEIANWSRDFRVWHYSVSYSQLLLRSLDSEEFDTRIDVLFSNVQALHLPTSFDRLRIDQADTPEARSFLQEDLAEIPNGHTFILNDSKYYVQATHCQWHEDKGGPRTPSKFGPFKGVD